VSASRPLTLRPATRADLATIRALLAANQLPEAELDDYIEHFVVAEAGGRVVGCGGLEPYGHTGLLRSIAVNEAWRGRRLGARLTEWVFERARSLGIERLYLFTMGAREFFARFGFEEVTLDDFAPSARGSAQYRAVRRSGEQWGITAMARRL